MCLALLPLAGFVPLVGNAQTCKRALEKVYFKDEKNGFILNADQNNKNRKTISMRQDIYREKD
jgi:hypothetical protein